MVPILKIENKWNRIEGEREITLSFVDLLYGDFVEKDRNPIIYFT